MLNSREESINCGVFHGGPSRLGAQFPAACSVPRVIPQRSGSGKRVEDVALLLLGRDDSSSSRDW